MTSRPIEQNPGTYLIQYCNQRANKVRERIYKRDQPYNIKFFGDYTIINKGQVLFVSVNKAIRVLDAIEEERRYVLEKFPMNKDLIDQQVRINILKIKLILASIKC